MRSIQTLCFPALEDPISAPCLVISDWMLGMGRALLLFSFLGCGLLGGCCIGDGLCSSETHFQNQGQPSSRATSAPRLKPSGATPPLHACLSEGGHLPGCVSSLPHVCSLLLTHRPTNVRSTFSHTLYTLTSQLR